MVFQCTSFSSENLLQEKVAGTPGTIVAGVINQWARNFRLALPSKPTVCLAIPAAHAFLLAQRAGLSYGVPVPRTGSGKNRAALGLAHLSDLIKQAIKASDQDQEGLLEERMAESRTDNLLQPNVLQDIADFIRRAAQSLPDMKAEAVAHISVLQSTVDQMVQDAQASSQKAFALKHMVHALIVSGYVHSSADMLPMLRAALRTIVRVPELVKALDSDLCQPHKVPSSSTLYRHRLTVHIGLCRWVQDREVFEVYMDKQGFCRWATLDSSPQGAWDWMLSGSTAVGLSKLRVCFEKANELIRLGNQTCSDQEATETNVCQQHLAATKELAQYLCMHQLTPTALGSGRSSLVHKVHAVAHSTRLSAADWRYTCRIMNATFSWTGDLGVESGMPGFKGNVCRLFGDWALQEAFPEDYESATANEREQASLRGAWSRAKFAFNAQGAREGRDASGGSKKLDLDVVDEAIQSRRFWAYLHMIKHIGETIDHIMFWCESCPCHGHNTALQGKSKHRLPGLHSRIGMASCPLQARRAPECAAGRLLEIAREGFQASQREVLLSPSLASGSEADQTAVINDFNHARRYSMLVCTLKFSHWEQLPWLLLGIAHHDTQTARSCAARALQLQDAAPCEHELARLLCSAGSQGRAEMTAFVRGEPLSNLALLKTHASKFKFVPISERWVESRHALIKRHLRKCTHASALHVAFMSCQSLLRDIFQNMPHEFERLVLLCELTKNPLLALQSVKLHWHPQVQRVLQTSQKELARSYRPWVIELLYHVDKATLFQDLPADGGFVPDDNDGGDPPGPSKKVDPENVGSASNIARSSPTTPGTAGGGLQLSTQVQGQTEAMNPCKLVPGSAVCRLCHDLAWRSLARCLVVEVYAIAHLRAHFDSHDQACQVKWAVKIVKKRLRLVAGNLFIHSSHIFRRWIVLAAAASHLLLGLGTNGLVDQHGYTSLVIIHCKISKSLRDCVLSLVRQSWLACHQSDIVRGRSMVSLLSFNHQCACDEDAVTLLGFAEAEPAIEVIDTDSDQNSGDSEVSLASSQAATAVPFAPNANTVVVSRPQRRNRQRGWQFQPGEDPQNNDWRNLGSATDNRYPGLRALVTHARRVSPQLHVTDVHEWPYWAAPNSEVPGEARRPHVLHALRAAGLHLPGYGDLWAALLSGQEPPQSSRMRQLLPQQSGSATPKPRRQGRPPLGFECSA
ncbi:unnamed protein product [Symbiodinium sp. CCMP2592]|nr:unnamed protein product [Symbiodinium sp. CCMP2592]